MSHFWYICHVCAWRTFARMLGKYRIIHRMRSHFSSVWRTCFTIPCCVSLFVINPFSIFKSENVFNFPFPERYLCCIWNFMLTIIEGEIRPCFKDICDLVPRTCGHLDLGVKWTVWLWFSSVQFSSVTQSCPTLWDPMSHRMPGLPVHHQLPESTQTYVHWIGDAIQTSRPLSSPSPPALNRSVHQGLFQWASSLHQVAKVLEFQLQHQSFQWTPRTDFL